MGFIGWALCRNLIGVCFSNGLFSPATGNARCLVVGGDAVAHLAAVVAPGGLLDSLQDQAVGVVDAWQN